MVPQKQMHILLLSSAFSLQPRPTSSHLHHLFPVRGAAVPAHSFCLPPAPTLPPLFLHGTYSLLCCHALCPAVGPALPWAQPGYQHARDPQPHLPTPNHNHLETDLTSYSLPALAARSQTCLSHTLVPRISGRPWDVDV